MPNKTIKKTMTAIAGTAALIALVDLVGVQLTKAWDYDDFKDDHYHMDALKEKRYMNPSNEQQVQENEQTEKELARVQQNHKDLQKPIKTFFWGKFTNKCPICEGRE